MTHQVEKVLYDASDIVKKIEKSAHHMMINHSNILAVRNELAKLGSYLKLLREILNALNSLQVKINPLSEFTDYFQRTVLQLNANAMHPDIIGRFSRDLREKCSLVRQNI